MPLTGIPVEPPRPLPGSAPVRGLRLLHLLPDGFGGYGGIAQFNRDLLTAACDSDLVAEIVALPRHILHPEDLGNVPGKVRYSDAGLGGKLNYASALMRLLGRRPGFDAVICSHLNLQPAATLAAGYLGVPLLLVVHGIEAWAPPRNLSARLTATSATRYVSVSALTLERFRGWSKVAAAQCEVLPCAIDLRRFSPGPPPPGILAKYGLAGRRPILVLARLASRERFKGIDEMLDCLPAIRAAVPEALYVVGGAGDDAPRLQARVADLGLGDHVRFVGYVPDAEKVELYRAAHAFVLAGRREGFGIVLLEAMACGTPVVASRLDGSFEAIGRGALGIAVDPTDPASLSAGVIAALARPRGVRPAGIEAFSSERFGARVADLLTTLTAAKDLGRAS